MESVKVCLVCKTENPAVEAICINITCNASSFGPVRAAGQEAQGPDDCGMGQHDAPQGTYAQTGSVVLDWPWGSVTVERRLAVGRDPSFSPLASQLGTYPNVSRQHAEVTVEGSLVCVEDLSTINGTYVNDRPIPPRERVCLADGDELRFAAGLRARVRIR